MIDSVCDVCPDLEFSCILGSPMCVWPEQMANIFSLNYAYSVGTKKEGI